MAVDITFCLLDGSLPGKLHYLRLLVFSVALLQDLVTCQCGTALGARSFRIETDSFHDLQITGGTRWYEIVSLFFHKDLLSLYESTKDFLLVDGIVGLTSLDLKKVYM